EPALYAEQKGPLLMKSRTWYHEQSERMRQLLYLKAAWGGPVFYPLADDAEEAAACYAQAFDPSGTSLVSSGEVALALKIRHAQIRRWIEQAYPGLLCPGAAIVALPRKPPACGVRGYLLPLPSLLRALPAEVLEQACLLPFQWEALFYASY